MAESAALLVDQVLPHQPMRQWVLSIIYRTIATHLIRKAGYTKTTAQTGSVTLIQRFGGALNHNIHFHMLLLDGVCIDSTHGSCARFRWVKAPTSDELTTYSGECEHRFQLM